MLDSMRPVIVLLFALLALAAFPPERSTATATGGPVYSNDGKLILPEHYRDWDYLTTGFDMSYSPMDMGDHHMFDNVFVNPESYASFQRTGTWPDKTMLVLEHRLDGGKASVNQHGSFQSGITDIEVHVKDVHRFGTKWAFFGYGPTDRSSTMIPITASCYQCHSQHAAVDTTFVQFYPTLLPIARAKETIGRAFEKLGGP